GLTPLVPAPSRPKQEPAGMALAGGSRWAPACLGSDRGSVRLSCSPPRPERGQKLLEGPVFVKVPFSPANLVIWKQSAGTYRENPDQVARVVQMVMKTQNLDWDDIQVILDTLMDSAEKEMVLRAAKERAREDLGTGVVTGTLDENFPTEDPGWDPNVFRDMRRLKTYQEWVQVGVQNAVPKTMNWSKFCEIRQEKKESPTVLQHPKRRNTEENVLEPENNKGTETRSTPTIFWFSSS
uniref:Core shell protein Gag P30 domain-containing protein n=1 Tax=Cyanistes caeruleus TaxID=156563 RepID=A0A8C0UDM0_CYACU